MPDLRRVANPPSPFESRHVEWEGEPPAVELEIYEEHAKSIISENDSPDVGFRFGVNPYRGCFHGCVYCYARPGHQYLGFGAGTDFERKIVVKVNAAELLDRELTRGRCAGETLAFSGVTDCYQPIEATYGITRQCLEVCLAHGQRVGVITKGTTIRRDVELLASLRAQVFVSVAFSDDAMRRGFDPFAAPIEARFATIKLLSDAGIRVGVALAPIIPGVSDSMIPEILERAHAAGARRAFMSLVRLPREVREVFDVSLSSILPARAHKVRNAIAGMRGGGGFGDRMRGQGPRWDAIEQLYAAWIKKLGMNVEEADDPPPPPKGQLSLF
jgi:DNA repair photolyase